MTPAPPFFVPFAPDPGMDELLYADLARWCNRPVTPLGERIYAITYNHDGEEWTATVGEALHGVRRRAVRTRGKLVERTQPLRDSAIVVAIFPGHPFMVVTNHRLVVDIGSAWENPFYVGRPTAITLFG